MRVSTQQFFQSGIGKILDQQEQLIDLQKQVASQLRVETASDDPIAFNRIFTYQQEIVVSERYMYNAGLAMNSNEQEEASLTTATDLMQRVNTLVIQSINGAMNENDHQAIVTELEAIRDQMLAIANTKVNGEFLFAGYKSFTQPFVQTPTGVSYNGGQKAREIQINDTVTVTYADSGFTTFMDIPTGNGDFSTDADSNNVGDGVINIGSVTDRAAYQAVSTETFSINFVTNANGDLAYNVFGSLSGQVVPALPLDATNDAVAYIDGGDIAFSGATVSITREPVVGDLFTLSPSVSQDIFTTLQQTMDAISLPEMNPGEQGVFQTRIASAHQNILNSMDNFDIVRSGVGARLNKIDTQMAVNENFIFTAKKGLSDLRDADPAKVISELAQLSNNLEASQASYARIQNLSLFNFI